MYLIALYIKIRLEIWNLARSMSFCFLINRLCRLLGIATQSRVYCIPTRVLGRLSALSKGIWPLNVCSYKTPSSSNTPIPCDPDESPHIPTVVVVRSAETDLIKRVVAGRRVQYGSARGKRRRPSVHPRKGFANNAGLRSSPRRYIIICVR